MDSLAIGVVSALWLGILTSISPCPLATNIAVMSFIGKDLSSPQQVFLTGIFYTLGRTLAYSVLAALVIASVLAIPEVSFWLETYMNKLLGPILMSDLPEAVLELLPRLRDRNFTRILLVTLPEATPVHEAGRLQQDLLRAGIEPFAWVINQSFSGDAFRDPALVERGSRELPYIAEVGDRYSSRVALIPWKAEAPVGPERLRGLATNSILLAEV
ncbi:MAG: sulfite exporter TauE/SafE family protein [Acidobacteria bacterium]|nr:sulfite exporter TauE/SafE family protein [Acidobacteriota bacterium]